MSIKCKISGSFPDNSGYASSNRADATALYTAGVDVTLEFVPQTLQTAPHGWEGELCKHLENRDINYKIKLLHLTPDLYPKYIEDGKYHISRLVHETNKLPEEWVKPCNMMNEIWTMTEAQKQIFQSSGVTVPIHVFPEPLDITNAETAIESWIIPSFNGTVFYSIFQFIERKDPWSLLTTYWKTFQKNENVVLILKTYRNSYSESDFNKIKEDIARWKKGMKQVNFPRVLLIKDLWPMEKVWKLHKMGGTFVSTSHQEGWLRGAAEGMLVGNPLVAIKKTGIVDILPPDLFYPIDCAEAQTVPQSSIPWYTQNMTWFNIDQAHLSKTLLEIYNNPKEARERGQKASDFVKTTFNYHVVGEQMKNRLEAISAFL